MISNPPRRLMKKGGRFVDVEETVCDILTAGFGSARLRRHQSRECFRLQSLNLTDDRWKVSDGSSLDLDPKSVEQGRRLHQGPLPSLAMSLIDTQFHLVYPRPSLFPEATDCRWSRRPELQP
jgi:hypothetical protein